MSDQEISLTKLREIIKDELANVNEVVDHKSINSVVGVASKLLAAVEGFKEKAPPAAINAVTPHLGELEKVLENMLSSPGSYIPVQKKEPKMVSLKAVKGSQKESAMPQIPNLQAQYVKAMADKKGVKVKPVATGYEATDPRGQSTTFKSRAELIKYLNGY